MWNDPLPSPGDLRYAGRNFGRTTRERPTAVRVRAVTHEPLLMDGGSWVDFGAIVRVETPRGDVADVFADELFVDPSDAARQFHDPPRLEDVELFPG